MVADRKFAGVKGRRGAIALEYALVLAFVSVVVLAALIPLGGQLTNLNGKLGDNTTAAADTQFK